VNKDHAMIKRIGIFSSILTASLLMD